MSKDKLKNTVEEIILSNDTKISREYISFTKTGKYVPIFVRDESLLSTIRETLDKLGMTDREVKPAGNGLSVGDIFVGVQSDKYFKQLYSSLFGKTPKNLEGYALPRRGVAIIKEGKLESVISAIGHELGHLFTSRRSNSIVEEAKAFAFEYAWCKAIQDYNISNLGSKPLKITCLRGLDKKKHPKHYRAHRIVSCLITEGYNPLQLYWDIAHNKIKLGQA